MGTIGEILKAERENRNLTLDQVHESTNITVQNLSALEEERFDHFPNRVYARAFLRDYANFLGLDSAELVTRYEDEWNTPKEAEFEVIKSGGSFWKAIGYTALVLIVASGLAAAAYYGWILHKKNSQSAPLGVSQQNGVKTDIATLPKAPSVPNDAFSVPQTQPVPPTQPVPQDKLVLEVTPLWNVWVRVVADGKELYANELGKNKKMTFEAKRELRIRVGQDSAVRLVLNGKPQPPLGKTTNPITKVYTLPKTQSSEPQ